MNHIYEQWLKVTWHMLRYTFDWRYHRECEESYAQMIDTLARIKASYD